MCTSLLTQRSAAGAAGDAPRTFVSTTAIAGSSHDGTTIVRAPRFPIWSVTRTT